MSTSKAFVSIPISEKPVPPLPETNTSASPNQLSILLNKAKKSLITTDNVKSTDNAQPQRQPLLFLGRMLIQSKKERPESHTTQKDQPATADQSLSAQVTEDTPPPPVPPKDWVVKEQSTKRDALVNRFFNRKSTADPPATAKSVSPFLTRRLTSIVQRYSKKEKGKEPAINARNTREKRHAASEVYTTYPPTGGPTVQAIA